MRFYNDDYEEEIGYDPEHHGGSIRCVEDECDDDRRMGHGEEEPNEEFEAMIASDRRLAQQGITVVRFASGESFVHCTCEDRPCCGCNS